MYRYRWLLITAVVASALITGTTYATLIDRSQPPRTVAAPSFNVSYGALTGTGGGLRRGLGMLPPKFRAAVLNHGAILAVSTTRANLDKGFTSLNHAFSQARRR